MFLFCFECQFVLLSYWKCEWLAWLITLPLPSIMIQYFPFDWSEPADDFAELSSHQQNRVCNAAVFVFVFDVKVVLARPEKQFVACGLFILCKEAVQSYPLSLFSED